MERIKVKCPSCGNRMDIDPKVIAFRCSKCSNKIDLDDDPVRSSSETTSWPAFNQYNTAHTERKVNDAVINLTNKYYKSKEDKQKYQIEQLKQQERNNRASGESAKWVVIGFIALLIAAVINGIIQKF